MADAIDSDFTDVFTDNTARWSADGVLRLSSQRWFANVSVRSETAVVRVYYYDESAQTWALSDVSRSSTTPLDTTDSVLTLRKSPDTLVSSYPMSGWTKLATGVYSVDLSAVSWSEGLYFLELVFNVDFENPAVVSKTSQKTGSVVSYSAETVVAKWLVETGALAVNASGQFIDGVAYAEATHTHADVFDGVAFATGFSYK